MHAPVKNFASPQFWFHYRNLPQVVRDLADKNFVLLRTDPHHSSLRLKKVSAALWSARVGLSYRALAKENRQGLVWIWIGHHSYYEKILRSPPQN